mmetsp:Transcript_13646/g.31823  ORF Transcript_13646/g.31823 Transcript_13646/m.31823 type:complete len:667 (+) Transcript_13646:143-2143(+)
MKFPAGSLAILASKGGNNQRQTGRSMIEKWNELPHRNHREQHEELENTSTSDRVLKNRRGNQRLVSTIVDKLEKLRDVVECDPFAETDIEEVRRLRGLDESSPGTDEDGNAFGILSSSFSSSACGVGRTCRETTLEETSSLGGLCEDVDGLDHDEEELRQRGLQETVVETTAPPSNSNSSLYYDEPSPQSIVSMMQYACDYGELVGYDCVCNFDTSDAYNGSATCNTPIVCETTDSQCGIPITSCVENSYFVELQGTRGAWNAEHCISYIQPYQQSVCYETASVEYGKPISQCQISLDGETCNACEVYQDNGTTCYVFDCGNTQQALNGSGARTGDTCRFPAQSMALFRDTYGCPSCNLCDPTGDAVLDPGTSMAMTDPEGSIYIPLFAATYECSYVQFISSQGVLTPETCTGLAFYAQEPCGCTAVAIPTEPPVESPTVEPTDSPVTPIIEAPVSAGGSVTDTGEPDKPEAPENFCKICPNGVSLPDGVITMPGSDSSDIACSEVDTAGMAGSIVGEVLCEEVQKLAAGPCCGVAIDEDETPPVPAPADEGEDEEPNPDYCTLCGPGKIHTEDSKYVSVPTQGIYTCQRLLDMGKKGTLDENGICLLVQTSAQTPCGCVPDSPTPAPTDSSDRGSSAFSSLRSGLQYSLAASAATTAIVLALSFF